MAKSEANQLGSDVAKETEYFHENAEKVKEKEENVANFYRSGGCM